jgi:hypothetical protein
VLFALRGLQSAIWKVGENYQKEKKTHLRCFPARRQPCFFISAKYSNMDEANERHYRRVSKLINTRFKRKATLKILL